MPQHLIRKSDVARLLQEPVTKSKKFPDGAGLYLEIRRQKNGDVKGYWTVQLSLGDGRRPQWFNIGPVGLFSIDQARESVIARSIVSLLVWMQSGPSPLPR
jgi:hypothetical protein